MENNFSRSLLGQIFEAMHYLIIPTETILKVPKKFIKKSPVGYLSFTNSTGKI